MARESDLEQVFNRGVRTLGGLSIKLVPLTAGTPDRLVLLPHRPAILVELKAEGAHLHEIQRVWHARARAIGHPVVVLTGRAEITAWLSSQNNGATTPPEVELGHANRV